MAKKKPKDDQLPLLISPSEALLLGLCVGEYTGYRKRGTSKYFVEILSSRLEPHVPSFPVAHIKKITEDDIPPDTDWNPRPNGIPNGKLFGFSKSHPSHFFVRHQTGLLNRFEFDYPRRSLLHHLFQLLHNTLRLTDDELKRYCTNSVHAATLGYRYWTDINWNASPSRDDDDADEIIKRLHALAEHNDCQLGFSTGMQFGTLIHAINEFEYLTVNFKSEVERLFELKMMGADDDGRWEAAEKMAEEEFRRWHKDFMQNIEESSDSLEFIRSDELVKIEEAQEEILRTHLQPLLNENELLQMGELPFNFEYFSRKSMLEATRLLQESDLLKQCPHAENLIREFNILAHKTTFIIKGDFDDNELLEVQRKAVSVIADARMSVWLAFGEILGVMRDVDVESKINDAQNMVSRSFRLQPADSPDNVHQRLLLIEQQLDSHSDMKPEDIVNQLGSAIEAITKRVWPEAFMPSNMPSNGKITLSFILHQHLSSMNELDRRYASIALGLYKSYRNPSQHDLDDFKCSFEEARYFLAGVRALVDIWRQKQA